MNGCTHGMPSPACCGDCMFEGVMPEHPQPVATVDSHTIIAQYPGRCTHCARSILVGDQIHQVNELWAHTNCYGVPR